MREKTFATITKIYRWATVAWFPVAFTVLILTGEALIGYIGFIAILLSYLCIYVTHLVIHEVRDLLAASEQMGENGTGIYKLLWQFKKIAR